MVDPELIPGIMGARREYTQDVRTSQGAMRAHIHIYSWGNLASPTYIVFGRLEDTGETRGNSSSRREHAQKLHTELELRIEPGTLEL